MELLIIWFTCPFAGMLAGASREAMYEGFLAGLALGPIGVIGMLGYDGRPRCDRCGIHRASIATICPNCGSPLEKKTVRWTI